ncbi:MAG: HAMP domain-containing histidine kinase [Frankia sp.]|nr:HAMP domain-containing histidine kinase [Frankia sp.]
MSPALRRPPRSPTPRSDQLSGRRVGFSRLTIRARLTLVYSALFLLAGVLLLGVTYALVSQRLPEQGSITVTDSRPPGDSQPVSPPRSDSGLSENWSSSGADASPPEAPIVTRTAQIAEDTWQDALDALLTQGGIALGVVGVAATAFGWLLAGRMLRPLQRITETARRIASAPAADRGLHERIALTGPQDEIKELADTFDVMLERLDRAFDGQRRFVADASHELRTPLTVSRALVELAVYRRDSTPEVRQLGETLLEINERHERLLDGLLLLARSEREIVERSYVDLADIVEHVTEQLPPSKVTVLAEPEPAPTTGNPVLLERLVQNLVDNGVRHNIADRTSENTPESIADHVAADRWVRVTTRTGPDGSAVLEVSNTGPVVPRYEVPGLFEPFRRLGRDRLSPDRPTGERFGASPGAGLGLSIVRAVARAHGGDVRAEPRDGGGLVVTVTLPAAAAR